MHDLDKFPRSLDTENTALQGNAVIQIITTGSLGCRFGRDVRCWVRDAKFDEDGTEEINSDLEESI